jgi:hypothetical protein
VVRKCFLVMSLLFFSVALVSISEVESAEPPVNAAELYEPLSHTWSPVQGMAAARSYHTATLLKSGKVLVAGGSGDPPVASSEVYDPAANVWSPAAQMMAARGNHTATLLADGKVLVVGGVTFLESHSPPTGPTSLASAEAYDPMTNTWSAVASMSNARHSHTTTLLPNGKLLVAGGWTFSLDPARQRVLRADAELYDPSRDTWSAAGAMGAGRSGHTATPLNNGRVLVVGGRGGIFGLATSELYDPATNVWSAGGTMVSGRFDHTTTLLENGRVLAVGGEKDASAELYDPPTNRWSSAGHMTTGRGQHTATRLANGAVLIVGGGLSDPFLTATSELYDPRINAWSFAGSMGLARTRHAATLLPDGRVLVAGGATTSPPPSPTQKVTTSAPSGNAIRRGIVLGGVIVSGIAAAIALLLLLTRRRSLPPSRGN